MLKKWGLSVAAILVGGIITVIALGIFNIKTVDSVEQFIHRNMEESNSAAISSMNYSFKSFIEMLEQQEKMMNQMKNPTDTAIMESLRTFAHDERFTRVTLVTLEDKAYSSGYGIMQLPKEHVAVNMNKNYTTIANPRILEDGELVIDIGTPAYINNEKVGRLVATIGGPELKKMYISNSLQGDAGLTLFTKDGVVITNIAQRDMAVGVSDNIYEYYSENNDIEFVTNTPSGVQEDMKNGRSGWLKYWKDGHSVCMNYQPFGINDWYMAISATDYTLDTQSNDLRRLALILTVTILVTVCFVAAIIIWQRVREQERIDVLKNTYSVAIRKTNDLFYEADIDSDQLVDHSENIEKAVWKETPKNYSNALLQIADVCAPECRQQFLDTFLPQNIKIKVKEGISSINFEYKIISQNNSVRWISATLVPISDSESHTTKLICMENDITEQMIHHERLQKSATLDGLTGLYNKITTQNYVDEFLQLEGENGKHALLIVDIDKFKAINDTLGHAKGDEVIKECGDILRRIFRKNDIVGRIGGDEFAILIKDYGVSQLVTAKAREICNAFYKECFLEDDPENRVRISASIGIALYDTNGRSFDELYKKADIALYTIKENGRNGYHFFEGV